MNGPPSVDIQEMLDAIESFPPLPLAVSEIMRLLGDENTTPAQLARKIEGDIGILTGVLKLANSPQYAIRGGVASAENAVMVLGFNTVRNLALLNGVSSHFRASSPDIFDYVNFMKHSIGVACCARQIAKQTKLDPDTAFVAGLLHDMGQLVIAVQMPHEFQAVAIYMKQHACLISEAELAILGRDHSEIGGLLAKRWNLPPLIGDAIRYHHLSNEEVSSRMADVVHLAEILGHALEFGDSDHVPPLSHGAMHRLNLQFQHLKPHFGDIEDEFNCLAQILVIS